jgi:hypothetical protein
LTASALVEFDEPRAGVTIESGQTLFVRARLVGAPGAYKEGEVYGSPRMWLHLERPGEDKPIESVRLHNFLDAGHRAIIDLPADLEPGPYNLRVSPISESFQGYPLELVGEGTLPIEIVVPVQ